MTLRSIDEAVERGVIYPTRLSRLESELVRWHGDGRQSVCLPLTGAGSLSRPSPGRYSSLGVRCGYPNRLLEMPFALFLSEVCPYRARHVVGSSKKDRTPWRSTRHHEVHLSQFFDQKHMIVRSDPIHDSLATGIIGMLGSAVLKPSLGGSVRNCDSLVSGVQRAIEQTLRFCFILLVRHRFRVHSQRRDVLAQLLLLGSGLEVVPGWYRPLQRRNPRTRWRKVQLR